MFIEKSKLNIKNLIPYLLLITLYFLFINIEAQKDLESLNSNNRKQEKNIKISSIARGISMGDELEYTDQLTLATALSSRMPYENSLSK